MEDNEDVSSILNFIENVPFSLPPLADASKQIRLLEILPDVGTKDEICCTMLVRPLDDPSLRYTAISYTWGEPKPKKYIYIDGRPLQVGPNCWHALWQVKNNARPVSTIQQEQKLDHVYWVDAICINQADVEEKGVQVAAMGRIYAQAVSVAACIGYESHDSPLFDEKFAWQWRNLSQNQRDHQRDLLFELIEHLLRRPWFHRLWTVQECIMARDIQVFCGSKCVRWRMLRVQLKLTQNSYSRPKEYQHLDDFFRDIDTSQMPRGRLAFPIWSVIRQYSTRECAVPHDRLYGLLSIVETFTQKRLSINYEAPLFKVVWNYAEAISNHRITDSHVELRPDSPTHSSPQYSSISHLAEGFVPINPFILDMKDFWRWRLSATNRVIAGNSARTYLESSSVIFHRTVSKIHCHKVDSRIDTVKVIGVSQWKLNIDDRWNASSEDPSGWHGKSERLQAPVTKHLTDSARKVIGSCTKADPKLVIINCSDNPEHPGEMHFLVPTTTQDGDFLVPMEYPADRGYFHLVCRPIGTSQMPLKAEIVGLSIRVREPRDSRAYMPWLRDKHTAEIYLRPYDLIAIALLEDSGLQYVDLPRIEETVMASHVVLRKATKEEVGY